MTSRRLRPGTKVHIPKRGERSQQHPMERLQLKEAHLLSPDHSHGHRPVNLTFTVDAVEVGEDRYPVEGLVRLRIEHQQARKEREHLRLTASFSLCFSCC